VRPSGIVTRRSCLLAVLVAIAVSVTACSGGGDSVAQYEATDLSSGASVSVESLRGRPALLVSWATWCNECDEELAGLAAFAESPAADGIEIVAVNLDAGNVDDEILAKIERHALTVTLWRDKRNEFKRSFSALGVPTTVLLAADGSVAGTFPGAVDFEDEEVLAALAEVRTGT
jgi:thiol-disulfide isomerase/thioredoxin